jgi:threonine-phosphate decarboxylase
MQPNYEYTHGGNAAFESTPPRLDLSANINPLGLPPGVAEAISAAIAQSTAYPDSASTRLRQAIANFEHTTPEQVFCANGASDIIFRLPRATTARKVMVTAPTFSDYERAAQSAGADVIYHTLLDSNGFHVDKTMADAIRSEKPDLVFLCNPNNPTGLFVQSELMHELLEVCDELGTTLVVDECFIDFSLDSELKTVKDQLAKYPKLVILKAFTKIFAMPGIRLGYALSANTELLQSLAFHGADWPVSNLAQAAGLAALEQADSYIAKTRKLVSENREALGLGLMQLGFTVYGSEAYGASSASGTNFVFFRSPYHIDLKQELDTKGIRIRSCSNYRGLDDSYYRVAVSSEDNNNTLLEALATVLANETKR